MRRHLDRRTLLRGVGAALALPWLEAMAPAGRAAVGPRRVLWVYMPNGMPMGAWRTSPLRPEAGPLLAPLAPLKERTLVLHNLAQDAARAHGDGPGDHARACASFLTGVRPLKQDGAVRAGISADQIAARAVGARTRIRSLQLGGDDSAQSGQCDSGYACAYTSNLSWAGPVTPAGKDSDPRRVFERLFAGGDGGLSPEQRQERARRRSSLLDLVREDARRLEGVVGGADRRRLEEYQEGVRELERRLQGLAAGDSAAGLPPGATPPGAPASHGERVKLLYEVLALAFETDTTRMATFLLANEGSNKSYPFLGVPEGHHDLSHHGKDGRKLGQWERVCRFHVEAFAELALRLAAMPEGEGSVLDQSMLLLGSAISDGDRHNHDDLPVCIVGSGGGTIRTGRHVRYPRETSLNGVHLALLERMGVGGARLGDASGALDLG